MSENKNNMNNDELNNNSFFTDAQRDESINLAEIVKQQKSKTEENTNNEEKKISPLEQMKMQQNGTPSGLVVDNDSLKTEALRNPIENDRRLDEFQKEEEELDTMIEKRKYVVQTRQPVNAAEFAMLTREIDSVTVDSNGNASINLIDLSGKPASPQFIRLRTPEDPEYGEMTDRDISDKIAKNNTQSENTDNAEAETTMSTEDAEKESINNTINH